MKTKSFSAVFFHFYDKKISEGTITFPQLGISKSDFTRLCTDDTFAPDRQTVERLCQVMRLTEGERVSLLEAAGYELALSGRPV